MTKLKFKEFCNSTGLHGWKHIGSVSVNQPSFLNCFQLASREQFIWVLIMVASLGVALFFIITAVTDFNSSTVVTTIQTTAAPLSEVFFPTIVVCNINQIRKSFLNVLTSSFYNNIRQIYDVEHRCVNSTRCQDSARYILLRNRTRDDKRRRIIYSVYCYQVGPQF